MSANQNVTLKVAALANDSVVLIGWDWDWAVKIPDCKGFALTRIESTTGERKILETHLPFEGQTNKDWHSKPSTVWPIQRKWWIDFTGNSGQTYTYEVQAMGGDIGNLTAIAGVSAISNPVILTCKVDETFEVAFTRGILSTQWLARTLGLNASGEPDWEKLLKSIEDYQDPNNFIRRQLVGNVPSLLKSSIDEVAKNGGHAYGALYELESKELVDFLLNNIKHYSLILGNTGKDDETNKEARAALHAAKANIHDRIIGPWGIAHNKFFVVLNNTQVATEVMTGSTNWTDTGMACQSNMAVRIHNLQVASNFKDYWDRLLADNAQQSLAFRTRNAQGYAPIKLNDGTVIETWFQPSMPDKTKPSKNPKLSPFLLRVKELMEGAESVLCGEVFYPGSPSVVHWMAEITDNRPDLYAFMTASSPDALRGVKVKRRKGRPPVFTIATGREKDFADFLKELLKLPDAHAITHGKIIVIDPWGKKPVVIFGSDNLGAKASYGNDENAVIVIGNHKLAQFVFVNMFDINKHFSVRAAARSSKFKKQAVGYTGRLSVDESWQNTWIESGGYKAREAKLLATGIWDGTGFVDPPGLVSQYVIPFVTRSKTSSTAPANSANPGNYSDQTANNGSDSSSPPASSQNHGQATSGSETSAKDTKTQDSVSATNTDSTSSSS